MAGDFDVEAEILDEIISYCVKIKLLLLENGKIYSFGLKKRLKPVIDKRNNAKDKFLSQKLEKESVSAKENTQSKVKYSKVKESKDIVVEVVTREEETSKTEIVEILEEVPLKNENILDEEKYSAIADYLENQTMFCTIQSQQKITENEVLEHFRFFYEQKVALKELKDQTQDEILRNFYFWVPIHLRTTGKKIIKLTPANDQGKGAAAALEMFELLKK
ncbi:hypothetical protein HDC90_001141 [Pedobacter sp. AK013]|nr:hypothetical protein [Pedobacter sp. AK013]